MTAVLECWVFDCAFPRLAGEVYCAKHAWQGAKRPSVFVRRLALLA